MKLIAVRLPDEVAAAVAREAVKQERSKSAVVVRALRLALNVPGTMATSGGGVMLAAAMETVVEPEKFSTKQRKACQHGNDPLSCKMPACRQARG